MLWFERQVVGTLMSPALDAGAALGRRVVRRRPPCTRCPSTCAPASRRNRSSWAAGRGSSTASAASTSAASARVSQRWKTSKLDPVRQYVRLLHSLVLFAENELAPDGA